MSTKFMVYPIGVTTDPDRKWNVITANSPRAAVMVFAIREWGLFHCAEEEYNAYDMKGEHQGTFVVPEWIDDQSAKVLKEAFHIEVLVERNPVGYGESDLEASKQANVPGLPAAAMASLAAANSPPALPEDDEE